MAQGSDDPRTQGDSLYALQGITRYWQSISRVWAPSVRGACLSQAWEYVLRGSGPKDWRIEPFNPNRPSHEGAKRFDINAHRIDAKGGRLMWAVA
jgi:hypothetical protein